MIDIYLSRNVLLFSRNGIGHLYLGGHTVIETWAPFAVAGDHNIRPCPHDSLKFPCWNWSASAMVVHSAPMAVKTGTKE